MKTLSEKIEAAREKLNALRDELKALTDEYTDDPTDEKQVEIEALVAEIEATEKSLGTLELAEKNISAALETKAPKPQAPAIVSGVKTDDPAAPIFRLAAAKLIAHLSNETIDSVISKRWGGDKALEIAYKAAVDPAMTNVPGWAGDLLQEQVTAFLALLENNSVFGALRGRGLALNFDNTNSIRIPSRNASPKVSGAFVGEGMPIPVRALGISSKLLQPHKCAVI